MNTRLLAAAIIATGCVLPSPLIAQDTITLPEICTAKAGHSAAPMASGHAMPVDQAHADLALGMDEMNALMMQGMTAEDIDVAFVCGMIPHHQGAITMAKAELAHGDDPWAREMAQKVIDAQQQEIAEMLEWLETQDGAD
jgi:uncharacterized protein (DUF305 family)